MDLQKYKFPKITEADMAFSTLDTIPELLAEAKKRGFYGTQIGANEYVGMFSLLFFEGGHVEFKKDIDPEFKKRAWPYCTSFMSSFNPKHEDKEAVCALLMSELLERVDV